MNVVSGGENGQPGLMDMGTTSTQTSGLLLRVDTHPMPLLAQLVCANMICGHTLIETNAITLKQ